MNNVIALILLLFSGCQLAHADTVTLPTTWSVNDTVTNVKLNSNNTAILAALNGGLDNNNANTVGGYHFYETKSSLPTAGSQGRVIFLTSDNSLNFDTGAAFVKTITPTGTLSTGQIPYYSAGWQLLTPGTQYYPLVSNGTSSNPSYQVLPIAGGGTGQVTAATAINALLPSQTGNENKFLTTNGTAASWGTASSAQVFTSSGTFTAPAGVTTVYLSMSAAGGGGGGGGQGGSSTGCGGGGAAGQYVINVPYTVIPGNSYTVTLNNGGAGGAAGGPNSDGSDGSSGGTTVFDSLTLSGGSGGENNSGNSGGNGAAATGGLNASASVSTTGTAGGVGKFPGGNGAAGQATSGGGGGGGGSVFGTGGVGSTSSSTPATPNAYGAGGGGGLGGASPNFSAGGSGAKGIVIVLY